MKFSVSPLLAGAAVPASRSAVRAACLRPSALTAALMAVSAAMSTAAWAQQVAALSEVMVTATRTPQPLTDVLADVSLLDRDTLSKAGFNSLGDVLSRLPGVEFTRNGGPAATTSLLLRGAETRHTLLLIDGVRVDSQSTGGAAWQAIPVAQIERVEVLRGPAAAIYGSDAIGGVVQVFTR
ncbi:MAG: TonB-dependent receptor plug domain-containing protein, partial [Burkholderiales bacterium]|nr:TonB-dependent receptor plug domain-containing protein [Burkholderiales bacterium]